VSHPPNPSARLAAVRPTGPGSPGSGSRRPRRTSLLRRIFRWTGLAALVLVGAAALIYIADCAAFYLRGKPQQQITVSRYMAAPLKGNKTELFFEGTEPVACAVTMFPQAGMQPCWYLRRHPLLADPL
jgi:hypothetical protein